MYRPPRPVQRATSNPSTPRPVQHATSSPARHVQSSAPRQTSRRARCVGAPSLLPFASSRLCSLRRGPSLLQFVTSRRARCAEPPSCCPSRVPAAARSRRPLYRSSNDTDRQQQGRTGSNKDGPAATRTDRQQQRPTRGSKESPTTIGTPPPSSGPHHAHRGPRLGGPRRAPNRHENSNSSTRTIPPLSKDHPVTVWRFSTPRPYASNSVRKGDTCLVQSWPDRSHSRAR